MTSCAPSQMDKQLYSLRAAGIVHSLHMEAPLAPSKKDEAAMVLQLPSGQSSCVRSVQLCQVSIGASGQFSCFRSVQLFW